MTPAQREKVREVLDQAVEYGEDRMTYRKGCFTFDAALDAIAAIMAPQWLPVAQALYRTTGGPR
jgi:hypothetical protein